MRFVGQTEFAEGDWKPGSVFEVGTSLQNVIGAQRAVLGNLGDCTRWPLSLSKETSDQQALLHAVFGLRVPLGVPSAVRVLETVLDGSESLHSKSRDGKESAFVVLPIFTIERSPHITYLFLFCGKEGNSRIGTPKHKAYRVFLGCCSCLVPCSLD